MLQAKQHLEPGWLGLGSPITYLSSQVHHDKEKSFEEGLLVLQNPSERQPLHEELNGHHTPQLCVPGLLVAARAQAFHDIREEGQLARLEKNAHNPYGVTQFLHCKWFPERPPSSTNTPTQTSVLPYPLLWAQDDTCNIKYHSKGHLPDLAKFLFFIRHTNSYRINEDQGVHSFRPVLFTVKHGGAGLAAHLVAGKQEGTWKEMQRARGKAGFSSTFSSLKLQNYLVFFLEVRNLIKAQPWYSRPTAGKLQLFIN